MLKRGKAWTGLVKNRCKNAGKVVASDVKDRAQRERGEGNQGPDRGRRRQGRRRRHAGGRDGRCDGRYHDIGAVADIMGGFAAASQQQCSGIDQVNRTMSHMDEMIRQDAALAGLAAAAFWSMKVRADKLATQVASFRLAKGGAAVVRGCGPLDNRKTRLNNERGGRPACRWPYCQVLREAGFPAGVIN